MDKKEGKTKRRSPVTKNAYARQLWPQALDNHIPFQSVLNDVWFASAENRVFIKQPLQKDFIMPLKVNRKVALSLDDKRQGRYGRVDTLGFADDPPSRCIWKASPSCSCWSSKSAQTRRAAPGCCIWSPAIPP